MAGLGLTSALVTATFLAGLAVVRTRLRPSRMRAAAREGWLTAFNAVGARILQPACGACANCGPGASTASQQVTVSAINRNFPGRSGPGQVWLASPATVAASAIAGRLASFAELIAQPPTTPISSGTLR